MLPVEAAATSEPRAPSPVETMRTPDLLSGVCHDLKAPLATIIMGAGFLRRALAPGDVAALRVVEAVHRAADSMSQLITNFSDLARLEMHGLSLSVEPCEVGAIVKLAFEELAADAAARSVTVSLELDSSTPTVPCDHERMLQTLRHLGAAALRVVPEGGSLVVQAGAEAGGPVRFAMVARRPPGEPSRRISIDPPRPALALAKALIELHGGSLSVVGDGDVLTLSFELQRDRRDARSLHSPSTHDESP